MLAKQVGQAQFMQWDSTMLYHDVQEGTWMGMRVKTSSLNEELGHVDYIFSDKTGTLTMVSLRFAASASASLLRFRPAN